MMKRSLFACLLTSVGVMAPTAHAFECSLSADSAQATIVKPTGESIRLGSRRETECQGIRVVTGSIKLIYAARGGVSEVVLKEGDVVDPQTLNPDANSGFSAALKQLGLMLAGDERRRTGMMRGTLQDEEREIIPLGNILWPNETLDFVVSTRSDETYSNLVIQDAQGQKVPLIKTQNKYSVASGGLIERGKYRWELEQGGKKTRGEFMVLSRMQTDEILQNAERSSAGGSGNSPLFRLLRLTSILVAQGYKWDAERILRDDRSVVAK